MTLSSSVRKQPVCTRWQGHVSQKECSNKETLVRFHAAEIILFLCFGTGVLSVFKALDRRQPTPGKYKTINKIKLFNGTVLDQVIIDYKHHVPARSCLHSSNPATMAVGVFRLLRRQGPKAPINMSGSRECFFYIKEVNGYETLEEMD